VLDSATLRAIRRSQTLCLKIRDFQGGCEIAMLNDKAMSDMKVPDYCTSTLPHRFLELVIVFWLIIVNCLYYLQFKALILVRLGVPKHR
jgi:hypothetical protein